MTDTIRVITTCTNRKTIVAAGPEVAMLPGLEPLPRVVPAERLYAGEQHRRLMAGVDVLRAYRPVEVWIISAKAGLISGDTELAAYDESFSGLTPEVLRERADALDIPTRLRELVADPVPLTIVLVGNDYFDAAQLDAPIAWCAPTIVLVSPSRALALPADSKLRVVPVSQETARAWSLPLTLLKGELVQRILTTLAGPIPPAALLDLNDDALAPLLLPHRDAVVC